MADNDYTSRQLHSTLTSQHPELHDISISTVKRTRVSLGWISKKTRYCALISNCNQEKNVEFCKMLTTKTLNFWMSSVIHVHYTCTLACSYSLTRRKQKGKHICLNTAASVWLQKNRPNVALHPSMTDYCDTCKHFKEQLARNQAVLNRLQQSDSAELRALKPPKKS